MKNKFTSILMVAAGVLLLGCYPQGAEFYEDLDVVYTNYDDTFKFASAGTYSMPNKIVKIEGDLADGEDPQFVKEPFNTQMLARMESNMKALGWTRVDNAANADVVLFPAVWTNTTIYYWYDYWCWYYPYYCGWGWGYPTVSTYTTGTLVMTLVANGPEYVTPTRVWTAAVNGLLSGSYDVNRVNKGIDQSFEQSPYLEIN